MNSETAQPSPNSLPPVLKYVVLTHPVQLPKIVFTLPPTSHVELAEPHAIDGYKPTSAGYVHFGPACGITTHGESQSLKLKPSEDDARHISAMYAVTSTLQHPSFAP